MSERRAGGVPSGVGTQLHYMPALDGIRAVSILGIMANHGGFGWAAGGVISVNVFFVLSGFLITMLLMKEWTQSGTIRLRAFWARRARRLLPALFVLLGAIALWAVFVTSSVSPSSIRGDALSTLLYVNNWHQILSGRSYFAQVSGASPLLHTWTLAIEEQFYLIWPIVVIAVLKWWRSPRVLLVVAVLGVVASVAEMAFLFHPAVDPSRLYYGTDTRAQDIMTGAALGILLFKRPRASTDRSRVACSSLAVLGMVVFVAEWMRINHSTDLTYRGGFLLADLMVATVILGVTMAPTGIPARILAFGPLAYVGRISYGLYLWHWPIFLLLSHARTGLDGWALFALRLVVTFAAALASWYLVETPVRQMTFGGWRSWAWLPVGAVAVTGALIVSTTADSAPINVLAHPPSVNARLNTYEHAAFPDQGHQLRVLVVGDSLSLSVGFWLTPYAARYGLVLRGRPLDGCGLVTTVPYDFHGTPTYPLAPCTTWPSLWGQDVASLHPQVVVLIIGFWEAMDRVYQGRYQHLGQPEFDAYERAQLEEAVSVCGAGGAHVVLMTSPYYSSGEQLNGQPWDEDSPVRVDLLNAMIRSVAAEHSAHVSVVPLNRFLDPAGHYTASIGGHVMRFLDGVHTTQAAGTYLAPRILPQLASAGRSR